MNAKFKLPCAATALFLLALLGGCGSQDPFSYVKVSGKVTYDDGSLIPVDLTVIFIPQSGAFDAKTHPRPGMTMVDKETGEFQEVTSHKCNDGLVRGKHKVTLTGIDNRPLPPDVVPPEYADPARTPLEVDTADRPFVLKVRKPR